MQLNDVGIFGKLPAHGDFIHRDLSSAFVNQWDGWLQSFMANSQKELGEHWLDVYLTSPIWRFAISDGIFDSAHWAGIMLPSVDRVGRYFPFCIATRVAKASSPLHIIQINQWFKDMEELAISALHGQLKIDQLAAEINRVKIACSQHQIRKEVTTYTSLVVHTNNELSTPARMMSSILDNLLRNQLTTYSVWATEHGSQIISPALTICKGLPSARQATAKDSFQRCICRFQAPFLFLAAVHFQLAISQS